MPDFPSAVPDIVDANPTETLFTMHGGPGHVASTNRILANLRAFATKLGLNNGTGPGAVGAVLRRTATGESGWGPLVNADVAAAGAANIAVDKLAHLGLNQILKGGQAGGQNVAGQVVNGDVAGNAAIAVSKLAPGSTPARVVGTSDGATMAMLDPAGFLGTGSITSDKILDGTIARADLSPTATPQYIGHYGPIGAITPAFDFQAIPQTYRSLRLVFQARSSATAATDTIALRVNGVITGFYYNQYTAGTGAGTASGETLGSTYDSIGGIAGNTAPGGACGGGVTDFPNYATTLFIKTWHTITGVSWGTGTGTMQQKTQHSTLFSGQAIVSIQMNPVNGQFMQGSYAVLYGMN